MKQTLSTQYVIEKDGLFYNDERGNITWLSSPFYRDSVYINKDSALRIAKQYNANVRKFETVVEVNMEETK